MQRFKNILLVSDLNPNAKSAFDRASALALRNNAHLTIVTLLDNFPDIMKHIFSSQKGEDIQKHIIKTKKKKMGAAVKAIASKGVRISCQVLQGRPFIEIIRKVLRDKHDLVILPAEGKTRFKEQLFGSTTMHLMRKCPCPVWVVKPTRQKKYFHILAAVDFEEFSDKISPLNKKIMDLATSLARWDKSDLHIIHAWKIYGESYLENVSRDEIENLERQTHNEYKRKMKQILAGYDLGHISVKTHIKKGAPIDVIPSLVKSHPIDLIVMGTVCRSGLAGYLIGNTAEGILQAVNCSVLTVKPDDFASPVQES